MPRRHQPTVPQDPEQVLAVLRGARAHRRTVDRAWCGGLREHLQDEVGPLPGAAAAGQRADGGQATRTIGWRDLAEPAHATALAELAARTLFRQWVTTGAVGEPLDDVVDALRAGGDADGPLRAVRQLAPAARRELAHRLRGHARWLERCWPLLDPRWAPVTAELRVVPLAGGRVLVGARSDLALGLPAARRASRCLVAVTDGDPSAPGPWHRLHLAALAEAVVTGAPPFQLVVVSPAAGAMAAEPVDAPLLWATASAVAATVRRGAGTAASGAGDDHPGALHVHGRRAGAVERAGGRGPDVAVVGDVAGSPVASGAPGTSPRPPAPPAAAAHPGPADGQATTSADAMAAAS